MNTNAVAGAGKPGTAPAKAAPSAALMFFVAETPIHAGAESSGGVIDLPIQREAHTAWPCVFGSGVKGAWREQATSGKNKLGKPELNAVFGHSEAEHAGALAVGDLCILALPVRSLNSHFKWVTCPAVLSRFVDAAKRIGLSSGVPGLPADFASSGNLPQAWSAGPAQRLVLEEFAFVCPQNANTTLWSEKIAGWTGKSAEVLKEGLVLVPDKYFRWFAEHATAVAAHVRLDDKKRVESGQFWYEETLPPDAMLFTTVCASDSRAAPPAKPTDDSTEPKVQTAKLSAPEVYGAATSVFGDGNGYLRVGGNESLGMGWGRVRFTPVPPPPQKAT